MSTAIAEPEARPDELQVLKEKVLADFSSFCDAMLDPDYFDTQFHVPLCRWLQHEPSQDKLMVMPRTHLKTTIMELYALWRALKDPSIRILISGNTTANARKTVRMIMSYVEQHRLIHLLFPELIPDFNAREVRWSHDCATLKRPHEYPEGTWEAAGIGTAVVRRHFNIIIEDDTIAPVKDELTGEEFMPSRDSIEKAVGFHRLTGPLLMPGWEGDRLYIGTRWTPNDVIHYIQEKESDETLKRHYVVWDRPAIDPVTEKPTYKKFSLDILEVIRRGLGQYMFNALYLNKPLDSALMHFRPEWTRYYEEDELPTDGNVVVTLDPADAPTGKSSQCYSVALAALNSKRGLYVLKYYRARIAEGTLIEKTLDMAEEFDAIKIRIEVDRYANLEAGFRLAMTNRNKWFAIEAVKTKGRSKEARITRLVPIAQNGRLFIKRHMKELESELYQFPHSRTNDVIDALAWHVMRDLEMPEDKPLPEKGPLSPTSWTFDQIFETLRPTGYNKAAFHRHFA